VASHQILVVPTQQMVDFNQLPTVLTDHGRASTFREWYELLHLNSLTCGECKAKMRAFAAILPLARVANGYGRFLQLM
jgi:hypothetical protein